MGNFREGFSSEDHPQSHPKKGKMKYVIHYYDPDGQYETYKIWGFYESLGAVLDGIKALKDHKAAKYFHFSTEWIVVHGPEGVMDVKDRRESSGRTLYV